MSHKSHLEATASRVSAPKVQIAYAIVKAKDTKMGKTVLITGSSSGIGKATALYFHEKEWSVVATMRTPDKHKKEFPKEIDLIRLDVTDLKSIKEAVQFTIKKYGKLDVVVNNAGYGVIGPLEALTVEQIREQYETNFFGLIEVTKQVLPVMRKQKSGVIVNVSSIGGKMAFPFYTAYLSSKWAVEGLSEGLWYEMKPLGVRVKLIEPGIIKTNFLGGEDKAKDVPPEYRGMIDRMEKHSVEVMGKGKYSEPIVVAKTIYKAATDGKWKLRYTTGKYARMFVYFRKILPDQWFLNVVGKHNHMREK